MESVVHCPKMEASDTLSDLRCVIKRAPHSPEDKIRILELMREYIIEECSDYNKLSEQIHVLRSNGTVSQNTETTGHDLVHDDTESKIEHKCSVIKTTAKIRRVNAQITFKLNRSFFRTAQQFFETTAESLFVDHPYVIHVEAGSLSFYLYRPLWTLIEIELETKMSGLRGGMQVDWRVIKDKTDHSLFISSIVYRLELAAWVSTQCRPTRKPATGKPTINIGSSLCKKCDKPHRLVRLEAWTARLEKQGIPANSPLTDTLECLSPELLCEFYAAKNTC